MKSNNLIIIVVLAVVAFLFFRNSSATSYKGSESGKTVGLTPSTNNTVQDLIGGLVSIFSSKDSAYTYNMYD
jgi:hypothetical protein